jgi:hypothetical protein
MQKLTLEILEHNPLSPIATRDYKVKMTSHLSALRQVSESIVMQQIPSFLLVTVNDLALIAHYFIFGESQ